MKHLVFFAVVFFGVTAYTQDKTINLDQLKLTYDAQFRVRNHHREFSFTSSGDRRNLTEFRARLGLTGVVNDRLSFRLVPQATKNYGELISATNDENDSTRLSSGDKYHSGVDLFEGYVTSKWDSVTFLIGRQRLNYGDNIVLGTRNWTTGGLSYDAVKAVVDVGLGELDLVYSSISEGDDTGTTEDDQILAFAYWKILKSKPLELDLYYINDNEAQVLETHTTGFRFKYRGPTFDFRTENIYQRNRQAEEDEYNVNFEVGYLASGSLRAFLGYAEASSGYDHLYTNRHRYNGIIDIVGRQNLNTLNAGLNFRSGSSWVATLEYFQFQQNETGVGAYNQSTSSVLSGDASQSDVGQEVDLLLSYKPSKNEKLTLGVSHFIHGDYFTTSDPSNFVYIEYLFNL
ncbi:MAG: hypothetical protein CL675_11045 [Bdellovibrionaceae bacterium]|nr:hypothetical protein [Pseudobdellovibrionaceae bacterium]